MVSSSADGGLLKELLIISGLIGIQVAYSVYIVFLNRVLGLGVDPLFIIILGSLVQAVFVLPFAVALERKKWPARLSPILMGQLILIAFGGITAYQYLLLLGIKKTSPAIASAMPNLTPGVIFLISACLRFEKFEKTCNYSRAKVFGTLVCLSGALFMSFLQNPTSTKLETQKGDLAGMSTYQDWIIGCFCLLSAVVIYSCNSVLQAATMINFPAPLSLCTICFLIGAALTVLLQIITKGKLDVGSPVISMGSIILFGLMGGSVTGLCYAFQIWCVSQKGPVMVSIFSPLQTICSTVLSAIFLRQFLNLASFSGMFFMFIGLYIVLWAKRKERCDSVNVGESTTHQSHDIEKPLLS